MFEVLKWVQVENVYVGQMCLNGMKSSKNGSESKNAKITGENDIDCMSLC
jgi:hypothetical protein